jgi:exopolysaccharide biosynthesis polyprenyl glycosylphosphotransferase
MLQEITRKYFTKIIFWGDVVVFWIALSLTLAIRYGIAEFNLKFSEHFYPFVFIMFIWLIVFHFIDLYAYTNLRNTIRDKRKLLMGIFVSSIISFGVFYLFQSTFKITPKTNFFLFIVIFLMIDYLWRYLFIDLVSKRHNHNKILLITSSLLKESIMKHINGNPQFGYFLLEYKKETGSIEDAVRQNNCSAVIVDFGFLSKEKTPKELYELIAQNVEVMSLADFYESIFSRVPLSEINEEWFVTQIKLSTNVYKKTKAFLDAILALVLVILLSPIFIFVAILISCTSKGPILYRQVRIGKKNKKFTLYKFRTMYHSLGRNQDADGKNPTWSGINDMRITKVGKILRVVHLDEMPQLFNILKGDLSFVGPRPERPEFFDILFKEIPHYLFRQTIKPGLTGWAQINFRYARTIMDSREKFEYDLYYIKNRNIFLDTKILLKTIQFIFTH